MKAMFLDSTPEGNEPRRQSPVDVINDIRAELAEFQRTSSKEAFRARLREELQAACKEALRRTADDPPDHPNIEQLVEYLEQRGLIKRARKAVRMADRRLIARHAKGDRS
jgi:hypothetical protein